MDDSPRPLLTGKSSDRFIHMVQVKLMRGNFSQRILPRSHDLEPKLKRRERRTLNPLHRDQFSAKSPARNILISWPCEANGADFRCDGQRLTHGIFAAAGNVEHNVSSVAMGNFSNSFRQAFSFDVHRVMGAELARYVKALLVPRETAHDDTRRPRFSGSDHRG